MVIIGPEQDAEAANAIIETLGKLGYGFKELEMQYGALQRIPHTFGAVFAKKEAPTCTACNGTGKDQGEPLPPATEKYLCGHCEGKGVLKPMQK